MLRQLRSISSDLRFSFGSTRSTPYRFSLLLMAVMRIRVLISGQVQGVGFRQATAQCAMQLGLNGWVQNLPDGRVEAVFEGDRASVEHMVQWCQHGPPTATVAAVEAIVEVPQGLEEFRLRRRG